MMTSHRFYVLAGLYASEHPDMRWGQAIFNYLYQVRPELADAIIGTDANPYYITNTMETEKWEQFLAFIEANW